MAVVWVGDFLEQDLYFEISIIDIVYIAWSRSIECAAQAIRASRVYGNTNRSYHEQARH